MTSPRPVPSYTEVELTGPPDDLGRLMEALSGVGEIHFHSRSAPNAAGMVTCTATVATFPGPVEASTEETVTLTVQTLVDIDPSQRADPTGQVGQEVEKEAAALLSGIRGSGDVQATVVRVRPTRAARS